MIEHTEIQELANNDVYLTTYFTWHPPIESMTHKELRWETDVDEHCVVLVITNIQVTNNQQCTMREGGMDGWMGGWLGGWEGMKHFFIGFQFTRCPWWLAWFYSLHTNNPLALTWLLSIYMHYLWTTYIPMNDWSDMYAFGRIGLPKCNRMSTELDSSIHNWMVSSPLL